MTIDCGVDQLSGGSDNDVDGMVDGKGGQEVIGAKVYSRSP